MKVSSTSKFVAELLGTMVLVLMGCGAATIAGADGTTGIGLTGIALAFGLAVLVMVYAIGHISGCHINPAISLRMVVAGRMKIGEAVLYIVAQLIGAILGAAILYLIVSNKVGGFEIGEWGLASNGWGEGYGGGYNVTAAFVAEVVFTFVFLLVVFGSTSGKNIHGGFAGVAIGLALTLFLLVGLNVTGVSVNPARSLGPAIFAGGKALSQVWLFFAAPVVGAVLSAIVYNALIESPEKKVAE